MQLRSRNHCPEEDTVAGPRGQTRSEGQAMQGSGAAEREGECSEMVQKWTQVEVWDELPTGVTRLKNR